jgi:hypothetical protein
MKYCCDDFETAYKNYPKRGVSVLTRKFQYVEEPTFVLLFVTIDLDDEKELIKTDESGHPIPYSIVTQMVIIYCPWCGKNLSSFYKKTWKSIMKRTIMGKDELIPIKQCEIIICCRRFYNKRWCKIRPPDPPSPLVLKKTHWFVGTTELTEKTIKHNFFNNLYIKVC